MLAFAAFYSLLNSQSSTFSQRGTWQQQQGTSWRAWGCRQQVNPTLSSPLARPFTPHSQFSWVRKFELNSGDCVA